MKTLLLIIGIAVTLIACSYEEPDSTETPSPTNTYPSYHRNYHISAQNEPYIPARERNDTPKPTLSPTPIPPTPTKYKPTRPTNTPTFVPTYTPYPTRTPTPRKVITEYFPPGYYDNLRFYSSKKYCEHGLEQTTLLDGSKRRYCIKKSTPTPTPTSTPKPYVAPTPTQLPYTVDYKIYRYTAQHHGVADIPVCFEEHTHRDDGITYTQDVTYGITYKDRQGRKSRFGITFVLFDRGKQTEHIQAYETTSPGTFDDPPTTALVQGFKDIKSGKALPHHKGCK